MAIPRPVRTFVKGFLAAYRKLSLVKVPSETARFAECSESTLQLMAFRLSWPSYSSTGETVAPIKCISPLRTGSESVNSKGLLRKVSYVSRPDHKVKNEAAERRDAGRRIISTSSLDIRRRCQADEFDVCLM